MKNKFLNSEYICNKHRGHAYKPKNSFNQEMFTSHAQFV